VKLHIHNPRAHTLATRIAAHRGISLTAAVLDALDAEYRRLAVPPLSARLEAIADELAALSTPGGRDMTKEDVDAAWGHLS